MSEGIPALGPVPRLRLGRPLRTELDNQLSLTVVARTAVPRVELHLLVPAGTVLAPVPASGELLRRALLTGTAHRDSVTLTGDLHSIGGDLQVAQDEDVLMIQGSALAEYEAELYELVADVALHATFPAAEVAAERVRLAEGLRMARSTPHFPAGETLRALVYADHPYGWPTPTDGQVRRCGAPIVRELHRRRFRPGAAQLTVVGAVDPRRSVARVRRAFGDWRGRGGQGRAPAVRHRPPGPLTLIDRPGSVQTVVDLAVSTPPIGHPDHLPLVLATTILGGGMASRLFRNLRERHGYTYGPRTQGDSHLRDILVVSGAEVRTEVTGAAYAELLYELGRLATTDVSAEELEGAKRYVTGTRLIGVQTQAGLAGSLASLGAHGLDHRYLETFADRIGRIGAADVRAVAARHLAPGRAQTVMVGDAKRILDEVRVFGPVTLRRATRSR